MESASAAALGMEVRSLGERRFESAMVFVHRRECHAKSHQRQFHLLDHAHSEGFLPRAAREA